MTHWSVGRNIYSPSISPLSLLLMICSWAILHSHTLLWSLKAINDEGHWPLGLGGYVFTSVHEWLNLHSSSEVLSLAKLSCCTGIFMDSAFKLSVCITWDALLCWGISLGKNVQEVTVLHCMELLAGIILNIFIYVISLVIWIDQCYCWRRSHCDRAPWGRSGVHDQSPEFQGNPTAVGHAFHSCNIPVK